LDEQAAEILGDMADYLEHLGAFRVSMRAGYNVLQEDGQMLEFLERRELSLLRPDFLRVEEYGADGTSTSLFFDGKHITVYDATDNVFARAPQPGGLDDAVVYYLRDLDMRLPLGMMLTTRLSKELKRNLLSISYVEESSAFADPTHHIAGRTGILDFQAWLSAKGPPLPRRIVLTYRGAPGHPQHWVEFEGWRTDLKLEAADFRFEAPDDAVQVVYSVQVPDLEDSVNYGDAP